MAKPIKTLCLVFLSCSLTGCWLTYDSVTLVIANNSTLDTNINSVNMAIDNVPLPPGGSAQYQKTFYDRNCLVDFQYANASFNETYAWAPYFESWPSDWVLNVEITNTGISFSGDFPSEWTKM